VVTRSDKQPEELSPESAGRPDVWESNWRMVIDDLSPENEGMYLMTRSSSESLPSSTTDMITAAEIHFEADAIGTTVSSAKVP
jgi:hypothetical protein